MGRLALWVFVGAVSLTSAPGWAGGELPQVKSASAVVLDASTGTELFGKDADQVRSIASTTKIFVAMAVREHELDLEGWTEVTKSDAREARGGSRTRLAVGDKFRNQDLLRAMLIASDNRAPTALARAAGMDREELVAAMNKIAKRLKLAKTKFSDPTGLRGNVSTAREMALALRTALEDDVLRKIMADPAETIIAQGGKHRIEYSSTNRALVAKTYDVIGGKTGYTEAAGYCFITGARFAGKEVVMAFLKAEGKDTRFADFNRVAEWMSNRIAPVLSSKGGTLLEDDRPK